MIEETTLQQYSTAEAQRRRVEHAPDHQTVAAAIRALGEQPCPWETDRGIILLDSRGHEQRLSYPALHEAALRTAAGLRARGLKQGDRILLLLPTSAEYIVTLCGALLMGIVPCTVAAPASRARADEALHYLAKISQKLDSALLVVPANLQQMLQEHPDIDAARVVLADELGDAGAVDVADLPRLDPESPHHIQLTSGSTNTPKGVVLTNANVLANMRAITQAANWAPATELLLSWLPLYHDMGLVQLLIALYYQAGLVLMTPMGFLRDPLSWLLNISKYRAAVCAGPTFAYNLCVRKVDSARLHGVDLSSLRLAIVGAEPVPFKVVRDFTRCFAPYGLSDDTFFPSYGMAETVLQTAAPTGMTNNPRRVFGFIACDYVDAEALRRQGQALPADPGAVDPDTTLEILSMGHPVLGLEISVQDQRGQLLADRVVGELCVRGTSLTSGYFRDEAATAAAIRDGWYHTGDRGYMVDGEVFVLGRIKEIIIVRGRNYQPQDIEAVIDQHPDVRAGYSVAFGVYNQDEATDDVVAVVETKAPPEARPAIERQIQQALQAVFGFNARAIMFVRHGAIPRTTSGKPQRVLSKELYLAGKFNA